MLLWLARLSFICSTISVHKVYQINISLEYAPVGFSHLRSCNPYDSLGIHITKRSDREIWPLCIYNGIALPSYILWRVYLVHASQPYLLSCRHGDIWLNDSKWRQSIVKWYILSRVFDWYQEYVNRKILHPLRNASLTPICCTLHYKPIN